MGDGRSRAVGEVRLFEPRLVAVERVTAWQSEASCFHDVTLLSNRHLQGSHTFFVRGEGAPGRPEHEWPGVFWDPQGFEKKPGCSRMREVKPYDKSLDPRA